MTDSSVADTFWALTPFLAFGLPIVAGVAGALLSVWVLYTVVWKAVLRGLQEYYGPGEYRGFSPPQERHVTVPQGDRRHRSGRLTRHVE